MQSVGSAAVVESYFPLIGNEAQLKRNLSCQFQNASFDLSCDFLEQKFLTMQWLDKLGL